MTHWFVRAVSVAAATAALALTWESAPTIAQVAPAACGTDTRIDMRLLVVSADGNEPALPAIRAALDYIGAPHDVYVASQNPGGLVPAPGEFIPARLATACRAHYQGVILTSGDLGHFTAGGSYASALTPAEFQALTTYETAFGIRQVTWYTWPTPEYGLNYPTAGVDTSATPMPAQLTTAGAAVFPYIRRGAGSSPIPIQYAWTYLTTPYPAQPGTTTIPLLTNAAGNTLAAIHTSADGRQNLAMTFDSNAHLVHSWLLSYGVVNWVTSGLFIGERHAYISPQVDDLYIDNTQWLSTTPCGTGVDETVGPGIRIAGPDFTALSSWQASKRTQPLTANLRLTMAFNGEGAQAGSFDPDTLTPAVTSVQNNFFFVNHTWDHENLDAISYADATAEITMNNAIRTQLGLTRYSLLNLVQPDVSGLGNPEFLRAARDAGVRYLVSDTSKPGQDNPFPNIGRWNAIQPQIFVIPRRPNNLFFNVAAPADWAAEYNCLYNGFWGRDLTYAEILDVESQALMSYMLRGELDPWMFHQANLKAYNGTQSLLSDLLDRTFQKYGAYVTLPVTSIDMNTIGVRMGHRTTLRNNPITATLQPGVGIQLRSPVAVTVPLTGIRVGTNELYGGEYISFVNLPANQTVSFSFTPTTIPGETPTVSAGAAQTRAPGVLVSLTGTATDPNTPPRPLTYAWTQTSGPAVILTNATTPVATFTAALAPTATAPAVLGFRLTVNNGVVSAVATTTVTVSPLAPIVSAGTPQFVDSGGPPVALTGTATDPNTPPRDLTYAWTQTSGPAVILANATTAAATFAVPTVDGTTGAVALGFRLTVSNGVVSANATTTVTVRPAIGPGELSIRQMVTSSGAGRRDASGIVAEVNDVLVAFAGSDSSTSGVQTVTVSGGAGLTWRLVRRANAQLGTAEVWTATATAVLTGATISAVQSQAGYFQSLTVVTFAGSMGVGASAGLSAPTGAPSLTLTTTRASSLVFGVGNDWDNAIARTMPDGQALVNQYFAPNGDTIWSQRLVAAVEAAGTLVTVNATAPITDRWNLSAVEILKQ